MYIIQKVIKDTWGYWWNESKHQWEELESNAEPIDKALPHVVSMIDEHRQRDPKAKYSYKKV